jgi:hypothetical protein
MGVSESQEEALGVVTNRYSNRVASLYDFNDHAYRRFVETIEDAVDSNGILSPGNQGIWPKRFRENEKPMAHL